MKIIKLTLDIITLGIITILVLVFTLREEQELLPGSHTILNISAWDYSHNEQEVLKQLNRFPKKKISQSINLSQIQIKIQTNIYTRLTKKNQNFKIILGINISTTTPF